MRPLGIFLIGISIYILDMIHFPMISGNFGGFFRMLTDIWMDIRTDIRTDRPSYRDARTHLKMSVRGLTYWALMVFPKTQVTHVSSLDMIDTNFFNLSHGIFLKSKLDL